jgi:N-acetylneuraminic acid mutarotase
MTGLALLTDGGEPAAVPTAAPVGSWSPAGAPPVALRWFGQFEGPQLLQDGHVLVAGGTDVSHFSRSESALFDPAAGTWSATGPLGTPRRMHTLTVLADGRVLAAGGNTGGTSYPPAGLTSAELYDPETGTWSPTGAMANPRGGHSATLLPDGRVLVAGGEHIRSPSTTVSLAGAELFDPLTGTWTTTEPMNDPRWHHQAVVLLDGRVLVIGGYVSTGYSMSAHLALCELYDPVAGTWSQAGPMSTRRVIHQTVRLLDGTVLTIGGGATHGNDDSTYDPYSLASTERYDPATDQWRPDTSLPWGRSYHRAVLLPSGDCLVVSGTDDACLDVGFQNAVRYDPATRQWTPTAGMITGRWAFGATALADGRVLAVGGVSHTGVACPAIGVDTFATNAEVYTP